MFDDQRGAWDVEGEQLARGQLVIEPVDAAVLQIRQRVVPRRVRQFMLSQDRLLLPAR